MERTLNAYITTKQFILRPTVVIYCSCLSYKPLSDVVLGTWTAKIRQNDPNQNRTAYSITVRTEIAGPKFRFRISAIPTLAIRYGLNDSILF